MVRKLQRTLAITVILGGAAWSASGQVVGLYSLPIFVGDNLIAYQFTTGDPSTDTLDNVLINGVPNGATFTELDPNSHSLLPVSTYNANTSTWSIDYHFAANGLGGVLHSADAATVTLSGQVVHLDQNGYNYQPIQYGPGTYLLALAAPLGGATFDQIVGRAPSPGDTVETLDGASQVLSVDTFNGSAWNHGTPSLAEAQAAYIILTTPEPSTYALLGLGAAGLALGRRFRFAKK